MVWSAQYVGNVQRETSMLAGELEKAGMMTELK